MASTYSAKILATQDFSPIIDVDFFSLIVLEEVSRQRTIFYLPCVVAELAFFSMFVFR
jgi:hypothetical protein